MTIRATQKKRMSWRLQDLQDCQCAHQASSWAKQDWTAYPVSIIMALAMWKAERIWTNLDRNTWLDINLHSLHSLHNIPHKEMSSGPWSAPGPLGPWPGSTSCSPWPLRLAIPPWQRAKDPTWVDSVDWVDCRQLSAALSSSQLSSAREPGVQNVVVLFELYILQDVTRCHKMSALERLATDSAKLWKILKCGCCCSWFCWKMSKVFLKLCQNMPKASLAQLLASGFKSLQLLRRFFSAQSSCCQNLHFPSEVSWTRVPVLWQVTCRQARSTLPFSPFSPTLRFCSQISQISQAKATCSHLWQPHWTALVSSRITFSGTGSHGSQFLETCEAGHD